MNISDHRKALRFFKGGRTVTCDTSNTKRSTSFTKLPRSFARPLLHRLGTGLPVTYKCGTRVFTNGLGRRGMSPTGMRVKSRLAPARGCRTGWDAAWSVMATFRGTPTTRARGRLSAASFTRRCSHRRRPRISSGFQPRTSNGQPHGSDPPSPVHASDEPVFKKLENLKAPLSVFVAWYKLPRASDVRRHARDGSRIADHVWSIEEIVNSSARKRKV